MKTRWLAAYISLLCSWVMACQGSEAVDVLDANAHLGAKASQNMPCGLPETRIRWYAQHVCTHVGPGSEISTPQSAKGIEGLERGYNLRPQATVAFNPWSGDQSLKTQAEMLMFGGIDTVNNPTKDELIEEFESVSAAYFAAHSDPALELRINGSPIAPICRMANLATNLGQCRDTLPWLSIFQIQNPHDTSSVRQIVSPTGGYLVIERFLPLHFRGQAREPKSISLTPTVSRVSQGACTTLRQSTRLHRFNVIPTDINTMIAQLSSVKKADDLSVSAHFQVAGTIPAGTTARIYDAWSYDYFTQGENAPADSPWFWRIRAVANSKIIDGWYHCGSSEACRKTLDPAPCDPIIP